MAHVITDDKTHDGSIASQLIQQVGEIDSITADKGFDQIQVQQEAYDHRREGGMINIHPRKNAVISESEEAALRQRNQHTKTINEDGVLAWRRTSGYYRQSEAENMFFRYKKLFGLSLIHI